MCQFAGSNPAIYTNSTIGLLWENTRQVLQCSSAVEHMTNHRSQVQILSLFQFNRKVNKNNMEGKKFTVSESALQVMTEAVQLSHSGATLQVMTSFLQQNIEEVKSTETTDSDK